MYGFVPSLRRSLSQQDTERWMVAACVLRSSSSLCLHLLWCFGRDVTDQRFVLPIAQTHSLNKKTSLGAWDWTAKHSVVGFCFFHSQIGGSLGVVHRVQGVLSHCGIVAKTSEVEKLCSLCCDITLRHRFGVVRFCSVTSAACQRLYEFLM